MNGFVPGELGEGIFKPLTEGTTLAKGDLCRFLVIRLLRYKTAEKFDAKSLLWTLAKIYKNYLKQHLTIKNFQRAEVNIIIRDYDALLWLQLFKPFQFCHHVLNSIKQPLT